MTRPRDECPYERPFPEHFGDCPAYQPSQFVPLSMQYTPLTSVWTCTNLDLRSTGERAHRFYARCRIGDEAARLRWVEQVRSERLRGLRPIQEELGRRTAALVEQLWAVKGRKMLALRQGNDLRDIEADARRAVLAYLTTTEAFLEEESERLQGLGVGVDAAMELLTVILDRWLEQEGPETPQIPPRVLDRFPEEVRILLQPPDAA